MPAPQFSDAEVLEIRHQHARGRLDVRTWADTKMCSIETIRRIARGDTYRHLAGVKAHPSYGGLHAASPAGLRPAVGRQTPLAHPQTAPASTAAAFVAPASLPGLDALLAGDEPADEEAQASLARLQAALAQPVPGDAQASAAVRLLDELQSRAERPPKPDAELG